MATRSLLIRFPTFPFGLQELMPDRHLAKIAGALTAAGHSVEIDDYGTVSTLDRVFPGEYRASLTALLDENPRSSSANPLLSLASTWRTHAAKHRFQSRIGSLCKEIVQKVARRRDLDVVALKMDTPGQIETVLDIARGVRALNPGILLAGTGRDAGAFQGRALGKSGPFDVLLLSGGSLVALANCLGARAQWSTVPNIMYTVNGVVLTSAHALPPQLLEPSAPEYSPEVYPAVGNGEKVRVFVVDGSTVPAGVDPEVSRGRSVRMKRGGLARELDRLHALYGARAFHIEGATLAQSDLRSFLRDVRLLRRGISYSIKSSIENVDRMVLAALKSSGCHAIGFDVPSGSQRLLKDFYMRPFGVTQVEQTIRATRSAGLYTVTHLAYPCPLDDYHTEAETLRLIDRTRPQAAQVHSMAAAGVTAHDGEKPAFVYRGSRPAAAQVDGVASDWLSVFEDAVPSRPRDSRSVLADAIAARGVCVGVSEQTALIAALSGYAGREGEFCRILRRQLFTGDIAGVAAWVAALNHAACDPVRTTATEPWGDIQAAVGN